MPALLAEEVIRGHTSLVVAGTHGKTTTTSMLAFLLEEAGLDPSFLIGGVPGTSRAATAWARARLFVVEGDEYDCAFFDKRPSSSTTCPTPRSSATSSTTTPTSTPTSRRCRPRSCACCR
jgi:UDP-N-acetylmuramate-alanine ligase